MCGIFAYIGGRPVLITLVQGLHRLEYRGYDGAGVGLLDKATKHIHIAKQAGTVGALEELLKGEEYQNLAKAEDFTMGIAHTRWPTMGLPTTVNTHPLCSNDRKWSVVLNGIIENSNELTNFLKKEGYTFESQNDVETVVVLLEYLSKTQPGDTLTLFVTMLSMIVGAYALVVMHEGEDKLYCAKLSSPLCLGVGEKELFVASDPIAFREYTEHVIYLEDYEICVADNTSNFQIYKLTHNFAYAQPVSSEQSKSRIIAIPFEPSEYEIGDFPHYMLKEIYQQPTVVQQTFAGKINNVSYIHINYPQPLRRLYFLACGTSYYAALVGKHVIEQETGIEVCCEYASEFIYRRCMCNKDDLVVAVSQSGETADTREALNIAKRSGAAVAGIVNVVGSQIAQIAGQGMYLHAGAEIGVASTKAFSCQVCAMVLLSAFLAKNEQYTAQVQHDLHLLPNAIQRILSSHSIADTIDAIVKRVKKAKSALFLGRGIDYPLAMEGALKMKEISYIHAEGYPAGEMKHGPIALVDEDMPCFFILGASRETQYVKVLNNMEEIKTRKGIIITITDAPEIHTQIKPRQPQSPSTLHPVPSPVLSPSSGVLSLGTPDSKSSGSPLTFSPLTATSVSTARPVAMHPETGTPSSTTLSSDESSSPSGTPTNPSLSLSPSSANTPSFGHVTLSANPEDADRVNKLSDFVIRVPHISEITSPMLMVVPLQLIAYKIAVAKGLNPDRPRNLAKSVTVE